MQMIKKTKTSPWDYGWHGLRMNQFDNLHIITEILQVDNRRYLIQNDKIKKLRYNFTTFTETKT